ncbi:MAG: ASCH domain-containing protein [Patescibacteria group bacterium]
MKPSTHYMKLDPLYFSEIVSGKKTAELRLYDQKRQAVRVGDVIVFTKNGNENESITCSVADMTLAKTFAELLEKIPTGAAGATPREPFLQAMRSFYPEELEKRHGVVAIHIKRA